MAIKKNGSRFTDRNRIRRMNAEGYSLQQIADATSIHIEHVQYVINDWDAAEEKAKDRERAAMEAAAIEARKGVAPANVETEAQMYARIKAELKAELAEEKKDAAPVEAAAAPEAPSPVEDDDDGTIPMDLGDELPNPPVAETPAPKRRKRRAA